MLVSSPRALHSVAAVQTAPKATELRELALPEIPDDGGLLRVLAAGVCGSDVPAYADGSRGPRILGHENVGIIERLGPLARERWGVREGDLVALEEYLPCGHCADCRAGEYRSCLETDSKRAGALRYGTTGIDVPPALWGGYSQFQYLHPRSVLHRVPAGVAPRLAALALPLGNGFQWAVYDGGAGPGQTVVIQGPGQQGLACVIAAKAAGAKTVIVSGLARDEQRLDVARKLGADRTVAVDRESLGGVVRDVTDGALADLVIDVSSGGAQEVVNGALELIRKRGTLLVAAYKRRALDGFAIDTVIRQQITLRGVRGHSFRSVETALDLMARGTVPLEAMSTHAFGLDGVDHALRLAGGEFEEAAIHVTVTPWS
ncbi:MAG: zinc-binding dehydrogenase [Candidatus Eremiobacteraeota bacterium]|nr:zinc-binding dehydrogenase [Candidatus Eremiobacteraeota bacterium]